MDCFAVGLRYDAGTNSTARCAFDPLVCHAEAWSVLAGQPEPSASEQISHRSINPASVASGKNMPFGSSSPTGGIWQINSIMCGRTGLEERFAKKHVCYIHLACLLGVLHVIPQQPSRM